MLTLYSKITIIAQVLQNEVQEFYEEILALIYDLTSKQVSPDMWKVFELLYQVFMKNGTDHFTDMMPALHNYVTIDTDAFLSDEKRLLAIFNMCKEILTKDSGEDPESHAAKLLEVVLLQCRGTEAAFPAKENWRGAIEKRSLSLASQHKTKCNVLLTILGKELAVNSLIHISLLKLPVIDLFYISRLALDLIGM